MSFKSEPLLVQIKEALSGDEQLAKQLTKKTQSLIVFNLKNKQNETKAWALDLKEKGQLTDATKEDIEKADLVINVADLDFKKLVLGKKNAQQLFLGGKLKVKGDVMKAANIETVLKKVAPKAKL